MLPPRHPEAAAKRPSKGDGPGRILRGSLCSAPQDDGDKVFDSIKLNTIMPYPAVFKLPPSFPGAPGTA